MVLFIILAISAVAAALGMLFSRNAVHSALFLVLNFAIVAALYLTLNAPFIAMVQITVYAGAIIVLFLFVIMLLGAEQLRGVAGDGGVWQRWLAGGLTAVLLISFASILFQGNAITPASAAGVIDTSPAALGLRLFEAYVFPFEVTGVLLLAAIIGVVVLSISKKRGQQ
ncbi:MAG: NADH-quinone oxidoreductase subunit J [Ardenticatenaceae bacterium]|nr:NADH-quinone oxidoreductase subunit J [Ardenticatenaceae bacterium]